MGGPRLPAVEIRSLAPVRLRGIATAATLERALAKSAVVLGPDGSPLGAPLDERELARVAEAVAGRWERVGGAAAPLPGSPTMQLRAFMYLISLARRTGAVEGWLGCLDEFTSGAGGAARPA